MSKYQGYLIYGLRNPITQEIRYVGRSSSGLKRPGEHLRPHKLKQKSHKSSWIKSLLKKNITPEIVILEEFESSNPLNIAEQKWIVVFKEFGHRLTNPTNGGDGTHGWRHTEEAKRKIGLANKQKDYSQWKEAQAKGVSDFFKIKKNRLKHAKSCGARPFIVMRKGVIIGRWESVRDCARTLSLDSGAVTRVLKGVYKQTKGFTLEYRGGAPSRY